AGDVESDDTAVAVTHGQVGDLPGPRVLPHGTQQLPDPDVPPTFGRGLATAVEPVLYGLHHGFQRQSTFDEQLRRIAHLGVDDAVVGQVLDTFGGDPRQRLLGLHDATGVREGLQIAFQGAGVGRRFEPSAQFADVG